MTQLATTMPAEKTITYTPYGERAAIELTIGMVRKFLTVPTRSGKLPSDADVVKFMMLCKARELNPWVGDAYLTGYDTKDGPAFSLITAHQALLKRAEQCPAFDGMESGVIIGGAGGLREYREGDFTADGERLLGGWARVYRKDRAKPFYDSLALSTFSTGRSRWEKDPAGMIVKCAEGSALRKAFPSQMGGCYNAPEMEHVTGGEIVAPSISDREPVANGAKAVGRLAAMLDAQADPIEVVRSGDLLRATNAAYAAMSPEVRAENDAERVEWDAAAADGLDNEPSEEDQRRAGLID